jgi:hypothetical protein
MLISYIFTDGGSDVYVMSTTDQVELNGELLAPVRFTAAAGGGSRLDINVGGLVAGERAELRVRVKEKETKRSRRPPVSAITKTVEGAGEGAEYLEVLCPLVRVCPHRRRAKDLYRVR